MTKKALAAFMAVALVAPGPAWAETLVEESWLGFEIEMPATKEKGTLFFAPEFKDLRKGGGELELPGTDKPEKLAYKQSYLLFTIEPTSDPAVFEKRPVVFILYH